MIRARDAEAPLIHEHWDENVFLESVVDDPDFEAKAAKATVHVTELMERVRGGVDEIRSASAEQEKGNEIVFRGAIAMREVAQQVRNTTEEQARGSRRIRESVDGVRDAVEQINSALQEQSAACRSVVEFLEEVSSRTQSNEVSARRVDDATRDLLREAAGLRENVQRFRI